MTDLVSRFSRRLLAAVERILGISHTYYYPASRGLVLPSRHGRGDAKRKIRSAQPLKRARVAVKKPPRAAKAMPPRAAIWPEGPRPHRLRMDSQGRLRSDHKRPR